MVCGFVWLRGLLTDKLVRFTRALLLSTWMCDLTRTWSTNRGFLRISKAWCSCTEETSLLARISWRLEINKQPCSTVKTVRHLTSLQVQMARNSFSSLDNLSTKKCITTVLSWWTRKTAWIPPLKTIKKARMVLKELSIGNLKSRISPSKPSERFIVMRTHWLSDWLAGYCQSLFHIIITEQ